MTKMSRRTFAIVSGAATAAAVSGLYAQPANAQTTANPAPRRKRWDSGRVLGVLGILGVVVAAVFFWPRKK